MIEAIDRVLSKSGYREMIPVEENNGYRIYYDMMKSLVNAVLFVDASFYNESFVKQFREQMTDQMEKMNYQTHYLTVVCVDSSSKDFLSQEAIARQVCGDNPFAWIYDDCEKRLIIYENQAEDFYGLRNLLESVATYEMEAEKEAVSFESPHPGMQGKVQTKATLVLVVLNVLVFLICTFTGDLLYNIGTVGLNLIHGPADLYRIFTSMFLHADISHLFGNMILLYFLGEVTEKEVKTGPFLLAYFISGIWGALADFLTEAVTGRFFYAIGASGAIFGLWGLLLSLAMFKRLKGRYYGVWRIILVAVFSIYDGFASPNVAVAAHVGGLIGGFMVGIIICLISKYAVKGEKNED